uniref:Uncharacterized protein n=1 Tax=Branchiostoma floridae TaxID=7739 RepID=C3YG63_BRAFL|eukprot:XP_002604858.1 hypothetical protein BRAFLDRAFT_70710 [Branchiostoma floridae]
MTRPVWTTAWIPRRLGTACRLAGHVGSIRHATLGAKSECFSYRLFLAPYTGKKMTSSSSLRFGGGLRLGREEEDGDFDRNKANSTAVDLEGGNDESLFESPGSPEQFSARTTPPRRRGGKTGKGSKPYHRVTTPNLVRQGYDYAVNTQGKAKWNGAKGMTATSEANNATTQAVLEFVQGLLPGYGDKIGMVKAAVTTYFGSKRKEERRETKGKSEKHKKQCSRNTRIAKITKLDL